MNLLGIIISLCLGGFVHGVTGFGFAMVAMALLPWLVPLPKALFLGACFTLPVALATLLRFRGEFVWKSARALLGGAALGTPLGLIVVSMLDRAILLRLLGAVLILFSLNELIFASRSWLRIPRWLGFPIGMISGMMGAAFNIGGPPAIMFVYSRGWSKGQIVATLQVLFLLNSGLRVMIAIAMGWVDHALATTCIIALPPFLLTVWMGGRILDAISPSHLKRMVLVGLILMGIRYLFVT